MWRQEMLPRILHGCHFDTISSFSFKNVVPGIFDQTSYNKGCVCPNGIVVVAEGLNLFKLGAVATGRR
jgi:hypothetical protein